MIFVLVLTVLTLFCMLAPVLAHVLARCVLVITRAVSVRDHIGLARAVRVRVGRVLDV